MWNCWVVSVSGPHLFFLLLCCSIPASGSTLAAFPLSVRSCSAELSFSSMVQCSVVCCSAADMSSPLSSFCCLSSRCSDSAAARLTAAPESLSHTYFFRLCAALPFSLLVLSSHFNLSFYLPVLICPPLI